MKEKNKDVDGGFKIGDIVRHKKYKYEAAIEKFDWCGVDRAVLVSNGKPNKGWFIYTLNEIELVQKAVDMKPEPTEEEENEAGKNN